MQIIAQDVRALLAANYPAVLVAGEFADGATTAIMADSTAADRGYRVLATKAAIVDAWGETITDAEAEQAAASLSAELAQQS